MDWLDKLSIAAIAGLTLITVGMLANQEMITRRHDNAEGVAKGGKDSYALQMEMDKKIYDEVVSLKEQGHYPEAMAKLETIIKKYPDAFHKCFNENRVCTIYRVNPQYIEAICKAHERSNLACAGK